MDTKPRMERTGSSMKGKRVTVEVSWNLDLVPGWNFTPDDVIDMLERELQRIDHYDPEVRLKVEDE